MKNKPYFLHYFKDSRINSDYIILPLEYAIRRDWSSLSASEQQQKMEALEQRQIPGIVPIREMLELTNEADLIHPAKEHNGPGGVKASDF